MAVRYSDGASANGRQIAAMFGVATTASGSVAADHVEIMLGTGATVPAVSMPARTQTPSAVIPSTGPQGGVVGAGNGIPASTELRR